MTIRDEYNKGVKNLSRSLNILRWLVNGSTALLVIGSGLIAMRHAKKKAENSPTEMTEADLKEAAYEKRLQYLEGLRRERLSKRVTSKTSENLPESQDGPSETPAVDKKE